MNIEDAIVKFEGISLAQMDSVKLMNRTDRKYWFEADRLPELLSSVVDNYFLLEINGERNMPYSTTYYDTPQNDMYANHHRGKLNRYKIRRRRYNSTNCSFLEVKFKSNKGRTIKRRVSCDYNCAEFDIAQSKFISKNTPYSVEELSDILNNSFCRMTLVSKDMTERCTIDSNIEFTYNSQSVSLSKLVIVEVKCEGRSASVIVESLRQRRIKESGFSKYCVGRTMIQKELKSNRFKSQIRRIERYTY